MAQNPLRLELLRLQRRNYAAKLKATRENFADPPYVARYGREYLSGLRRYEKVATRAELIRKALSVDIVYHGDYHTLRHSQRAILAMLQALSDKRPVVLCLEMFHAEDQRWIDLYQAGQIEEGDFLRRIRYAEKWAYNFNPWRVLLLFCREKNIRVLGINALAPPGPHALRWRDKASARVVARGLLRFAPALVYVVDGDYHIAPQHLPKEVDRLLLPMGVQAKRLLIYQNVENLYWQSAQAGQEEAAILKIDEARYCLMNTVPATKLQSYLDWLEYAEDGYFPVKGQWAELWGDNYLVNIQSMIRDLEVLLKVEIPKGVLDKLTVFSSRNLDFADRIKGDKLLAPHWPRLREKLRREEGFLLEFGREKQIQYWIYLPNASVNQAAEEAAHFVHAALRGPMQIPPKALDAFYQTAMTEALGFLGSKLFNEKRKAPTETRLRRMLGRVKRGEAQQSEHEIRLARLLLQHLHLERRQPTQGEVEVKFSEVWKREQALAHSFATQLGYILGNRLYYASKSGAVNLATVRGLFHQSFAGSGEAFEAYYAWTKSLAARSLSRFKNGAGA